MKHAIKEYLTSDFPLLSLIDMFKYRRSFALEHPEFFPIDGIAVFSGPQGSGKTLSMVRFARDLMDAFPGLLVCSNVDFNESRYKGRVVPFEGIDSLISLNNDYSGVLYLIDEMHLLFNSLESKEMPLDVFQEISQQRKQRKAIVGTSQKFTRLAKPFREQFKYVIDCHNYFGFLQRNFVLLGEGAVEKDGRLYADSLGSYYFLHTKELYLAYDTYAKVSKGSSFRPDTVYDDPVNLMRRGRSRR